MGKEILFIIKRAPAIMFRGIIRLTAFLVFTGFICIPPVKVFSQKPVEVVEQQINITGTITDSITGETMAGVGIMEAGTGEGSISDIYGKYSINMTSQSSALLFSHIGYITKRITFPGSNIIDVKLVPDIQGLQQVVVVGYGTQK
jgi:hypothetical protein